MIVYSSRVIFSFISAVLFIFFIKNAGRASVQSPGVRVNTTVFIASESKIWSVYYIHRPKVKRMMRCRDRPMEIMILKFPKVCEIVNGP